MKARLKRVGVSLTALLIAAVIWLPCLHLLFARPAAKFRPPQGLSAKAGELAARHLQLWTDPALRDGELNRMRASNAEWDFMGRSYLVWSLANMSLREPAAKPIYLQTMDQIIDETLRLEKQEGMCFFLMPYAKDRPYLVEPAHSLFLDGEIALMLAARRMVEEKPEYKPLLTERVNGMVERFQKSPKMLLESYPDECWMFDHCVALDAIKMADHLDGSDHAALIQNWIAMAKQRLVDTNSGILISACQMDGTPIYGPEGFEHLDGGAQSAVCWMQILPVISINAPARNSAPSRWASATRMNGRNRGRAIRTLIRARSFLGLKSARVPAAWPSLGPVRLATMNISPHWQRR